MKEIPLSQGKVAFVDDEDYEALACHKWYAHKSKKSSIFYAVRKITVSPKKRFMLSMHRVITDTPPGVQIDHRDGNGLNNQRYNMRFATIAQNAQNVPKRRHNKSGFKGVHSANGRWNATIRINHKPVHLGGFTSADEAARAYDRAAIQCHGEFAYLNFPEVEK